MTRIVNHRFLKWEKEVLPKYKIVKAKDLIAIIRRDKKR